MIYTEKTIYITYCTTLHGQRLIFKSLHSSKITNVKSTSFQITPEKIEHKHETAVNPLHWRNILWSSTYKLYRKQTHQAHLPILVSAAYLDHLCKFSFTSYTKTAIKNNHCKRKTINVIIYTSVAFITLTLLDFIIGIKHTFLNFIIVHQSK